MKSTKLIIAGLLVVCSLTVVLAPSKAGAAGNGSQCLFEGTWSGRNNDGYVLLETVVPADKSNESVSLLLTVAGDADPTFGGRFPTARLISNVHGEAVRTGPQSFRFTLVGTGVDAKNQVVYFLRASGTRVFVDCQTYVGNGAISFFSPSQDREHSGVINPAESPVFCYPCTSIMHRITILNPCSP